MQARAGRNERRPIVSAEISVHDNVILSYVVDAEGRRITLHTVYYDREPHERTDVVFSGVLAYHFEGDTFGTVLFEIGAVPIGQVFDDYEALFTRQKNYGWPV